MRNKYFKTQCVMRKFRVIVICISAALIIVSLFFINYMDLLSKSNLGVLSGIVSMSLIIISMYLSNKHEEKKGNKKEVS